MTKKLLKGFLLCILAFFIFSATVFTTYDIIISDTISCSYDAYRSSPFISISNKIDESRTNSVFRQNKVTRLKSQNSDKYKDISLYVGGMPFGVKFITEGVLVVGFSDIQSKSSLKNPANEAGLRINDIIIKVNGEHICGADELTKLIESSNGQKLTLTYTRDGKEHNATLIPQYSKDESKYKSGLYVRDSGAGIGTVTFIFPNTYAFGGLGHGICDAQSGKLIPMQRGSVVGVTINGVVKGLAGSPGEVKGYFSSGKTGTLLGNTDCGVYGVFASRPEAIHTDPIPVCTRNEVCEGKAYIYCTLSENKTEKYEIEISNIQRDSTSNKCFTVKVTDQKLLELSGGIVQGMSGSPIIQNGKLVGAVTHVLINDPTTGYGIFIENMLDQMGNLAE